MKDKEAEAVPQGGLTRRELDVLRLVAEGLTDREVADALFLSVRTVHAHLRSIYAKLAVSSRIAATRYFMEREPHVSSQGKGPSRRTASRRRSPAACSASR